MEDSNASEKPFPPSPRKLQKAREKGETPRSLDLTTAAGYLGFTIAALTLGKSSFLDFGEFAREYLYQSQAMADDRLPSRLNVSNLFLNTMKIFAPWFVFPSVLVIAVLLTKRAIIFTPSKLNFKASRINPILNAKNKFGRQGLFEFAKSLVKMTIFGLCLGLFLARFKDILISSSVLNPHEAISVQLITVLQMLSIIVLVSAIIGGVDFAWQYSEHLKKNRMTRKELTDEAKEAEGDPELKQRRRQKAQEVATSQMMADVPKADVVIVNPTHFAVALSWARDKPEAPRCVAKGADEIAKRIRNCAQQHGIPIYSDPPIARAMYSDVPIGYEIHMEHYQAVAAAIRFADRMRKKKWNAN